jgi:hypothetical protein
MNSLDGPLRSILDKFGFLPSGLLCLDKSYGLAIAEGGVPGSRLYLLGYAASQSSATFNYPVWSTGASYTWAVANQRPRIASTSANDTAAGSGAQTVRVWMVNAAGAEVVEDVVMNGAGVVLLAAVDIRRVNRMEVLTCGGTGANEGVITLYWTDGITIFARINIGDGASLACIQTVPAGYQDVFPDLFVSTIDNTGRQFAVRSRPSGADTSWATHVIVGLALAHPARNCLTIPLRFSAGYDYLVYGGGGTAGACACALSGYRIPA